MAASNTIEHEAQKGHSSMPGYIEKANQSGGITKENKMVYFRPVLVGILFAAILHWHHQLTLADGDVAINCGSDRNLNAVDGREWCGELASQHMSGNSRSSTAGQTSFIGVDPVPYKTSRISSAEFSYTFRLSPGQKFIRLHFYPASYRGFEKSVDFFSVKAGAFTLLRNFSASFAADSWGVKYIVKEFCLNVDENEQLKMTFSPFQGSKSKNGVYAFVNGIEIISMPTGLYYTPEHETGARVVGLSNRFYIIDNSTALELIQRFNIGGKSIPSVEDFGMFRQWNEDTKYLLVTRAHRVNHLALKIKYTNMPAFIAPPNIYHTSWGSGRSERVNKKYSFTWKVPIDLGFGYLVRLHFCELDYRMAEREPRVFSVLMNNQIAESQADIIKWSGDIAIPVYRDYVVIMESHREGSKSDLVIELQSVDELVFELLKGLEIFKLSNLENNLAASNLMLPEGMPISWNLKIENFSIAFGQTNIIGTAMTLLLVFLCVVIYNLRKCRGVNFHNDNCAESPSVEPSCRCFSLSEIKLATKNFSDEFFIGRGGFGKVYKGLIRGIPEMVAIKRLNFFSRQGAREFWAEIETLSEVRHIHLVSLIGYCNEHGEMILVYEYISGGTLADNLYKLARKGKVSAPLSWEQRLTICLGAARGLEYLHTGRECGVIHRDVKDTNILLDENLVAKISDFGLSKLENVTKSKSYVSTKVKGTIGYMDPDYFMTHRLTRKSDVYSFGVVMVVVLSGKPVLDQISGEPQSLISRFQECTAGDDIRNIVDRSLQGKLSSDHLQEFVKIVESCLQQLPKRRPTMARVVASLEQALEHYGSPMITPPAEKITSNPSQNLASPAGRKDILRSEKVTPLGDYKVYMQNIKEYFSDMGYVFNERSEDLRYVFKELADSTDNFDPKNKLGAIYKGILPSGQEIAIKKLSNSCNIGNTKFVNVVAVMSRLQHENLVRVLGCCIERKEKMLIYEYIPHSSLDAYGSKNQDILGWSRRKIIIEGVAKCLLYLHQDSRLNVVHGDLTLRNILLDNELNPKILSFNAKLRQSSPMQTSKVVEILGHMAPEYAQTGLSSEKSDVYSYGVLLLEIISGKGYRDFGNGRNYPCLVGWAWELWNEKETIQLVDPGISYPDVAMEILRYIQVGLLCLQQYANDRPNMSTLLSMLKNEVAELPQPKLPPYTLRMGLGGTQIPQLFLYEDSS